MELFENDIFSVSRIITANIYAGVMGPRRIYNVNLPSYELIFKMSGVDSVHFAGKNSVDTADSLRYLPKGKKTGEYTVDVIEEGECIDIYFDTDDTMPESAITLKNMSELRPLFVKICNVWKSKRTGYYAECMAVMYDIVRMIKIHGEKYNTSESTRRILPCVEYMHEHYTDVDFDYGKLCRIAGLSYSYFKELFLKQYGVPPIKYITNLRIERAKELLMTDQLTVTEVAQECGYDNVYYFSKVFKKHTGINAKSYKNNREPKKY